MNGANLPLAQQIALLEKIVKENTLLFPLLQKLAQLELPNYYVGGGSIVQTVWNHLYNKPLHYGIKDIDIVYFDEDLREEKEKAVMAMLRKTIGDFPVKIDIANEARVHLWYEKAFGYPIAPYESVEQAISTWPTTATSVGIRLEKGQFVIFAPFGLNDLFSGTIRPNKTLISEAIYQKKAEAWHQKWPETMVQKW
ncbi:nucleotidyltransferase family protein [Enterococcus massiliensis]|uniref:nucleotidyltransferase family protein n=1 Tax=Enterococcus massiliensis TaxID=1640685 RepID=UPI000859A2DF|nr:nucleotidyltransferase family protein [Enterococcus massiliensis]